MALEFTRRDFMKCAGVTVLAVAAGGMLTACGGGGGNGGGDSYLPSGKDTNVKVNDTGSAAVQVAGWQDGWTSSSSGIIGNVEKLVATIISGNTDATWFSVLFKITNNSQEVISLGSTTELLLSNVVKGLTSGDYSDFDKLGHPNFEITSDKGTIHHADIGYQVGTDGLPSSYSDKLAPGASGYIKMYCIGPSNWTKLYLTYKGNGASAKFVVNRDSDKI